jgi:hypothetical protein
MILKSGDSWWPEEADCEKWRKAFKGVSVEEELDRMALWLEANQGRRKPESDRRRAGSGK